ncbi:MAG: hypothetical protein J6X60_06440, partial [Ruminiclostridium sp.]|nr:hypothetical protein [Ruminiclostridium sp.]
PESLFADIISQSRISQYHKDGVAVMYDRFAKKMDKPYIRGAVLRTYLYGFGSSADHIARYCLRTVEGDGLYGKGDITPAGCVLERLSVTPAPSRRDIPVVSVGNTPEINKALEASLDFLLVKDKADVTDDFYGFVGKYRRMVGNLEEEPDLAALGMICEPGHVTVTTSPDNRGDDKDTKEHRIGYVAYYNRGIMDGGRKVPMVLCFHGGGDSAMCMASVSGWWSIAAKYGFLLVCVEDHLNSTAVENMEMLAILKSRYGIDESRIYSTGFSMGGCKSWDMMQEYPEVFAAVAPMDATFEVGCNSYGDAVGEYNTDTALPVFYAGGELTPLPELPFQAQKCIDRMAYVFACNKVKKPYNVSLEEHERWDNKIWGTDGDETYTLVNPERENSVLTLQLFMSTDGRCLSVFGSVSNQMHEVRHHTCENAWKFMNCFRRLPDGTLEGGDPETIRHLYDNY